MRAVDLHCVGLDRCRCELYSLSIFIVPDDFGQCFDRFTALLSQKWTYSKLAGSK